MFFRFAAALSLVVLISMTGVLLEKRTLELRRQVSLQSYQTELLVEQHVRLRLETQRLTAPSQWARESAASEVSQSGARSRRLPHGPSAASAGVPGAPGNRLPLLRFQYPLNLEELH